MENSFRSMIAHNLTELRKAKGLTQAELAAKFGYTDKSVSKWEHGETIPDIETLFDLAKFYGISVDDLCTEAGSKKIESVAKEEKVSKVNKNVITWLCALIPWILFITVYTVLDNMKGWKHWTLFTWPIAIDAMLFFIFNLIWGRKKNRPFFGILFSWTLVINCYLEFGISMPGNTGWSMWTLFLIGIPLTVASILWNHVKE